MPYCMRQRQCNMKVSRLIISPLLVKIELLIPMGYSRSENRCTPPIEGFGFPDFFPSSVSRKSGLFSTTKQWEIQTFSPDNAQSVGNPTFSIMLTRNPEEFASYIYTSPYRRVRNSGLFPDKFGQEIQAFWRFVLGNPEIFRIEKLPLYRGCALIFWNSPMCCVTPLVSCNQTIVLFCFVFC